MNKVKKAISVTLEGSASPFTINGVDADVAVRYLRWARHLGATIHRTNGPWYTKYEFLSPSVPTQKVVIRVA
jgi:hypothetical protein